MPTCFAMAPGPRWLRLPGREEDAVNRFSEIERWVAGRFRPVFMVVDDDAFDGDPEDAVFHDRTWADAATREPDEIVGSFRDPEAAAEAARAAIDSGAVWAYVRIRRRALGPAEDPDA